MAKATNSNDPNQDLINQMKPNQEPGISIGISAEGNTSNSIDAGNPATPEVQGLNVILPVEPKMTVDLPFSQEEFKSNKISNEPNDDDFENFHKLFTQYQSWLKAKEPAEEIKIPEVVPVVNPSEAQHTARLAEFGPNYVVAHKGTDEKIFSARTWDLLGSDAKHNGGWHRIIKTPPEVSNLHNR